MIHIVRKITVIGSLTLLTLLALASTAAAEDLKIGYVDLNRALNEVDEAVEAKAAIEKEFEAKKADLEKKKEELLEFKADLEASVMVLTEEERKAKIEEYQRRYLELEEEYVSIKEEFYQRREEETQRIFTKMEPIIAEVAEEEDFTLVYEHSQHSILWADDAIDLTDEVIKRYNDTH